MFKLIPPFQRKRSRRGGAIVETVFCIPLVILLMMGTLEVCSAIFLYESLKVAAFEGVRIGTRKGGTTTEVLNRTHQVLASRGVVMPANSSLYGVTVSPLDLSATQALDPITVTISAPTQGNSRFIFGTFANQRIVARVTMVREFSN
jgi:Flp pilus assembly protein TadG